MHYIRARIVSKQVVSKKQLFTNCSQKKTIIQLFIIGYASYLFSNQITQTAQIAFHNSLTNLKLKLHGNSRIQLTNYIVA